MKQFLTRLLRGSPPPSAKPSVPPGERYYVVGDIHGRRDLFDALVREIEADDAAAGSAATTIVLLGDLIDRGPESNSVVEIARIWGEHRNVRCIAGNHEEMFLESFADKDMLRHFVKHGGRETILSYGLKRKRYNAMSLGELQDEMERIVPAEHRSFLGAFEDMIVAGDYVFVHAGVHPKRTLEEQRTADLRWIRERFLRHTEPFEKVVVHGHTIFDKVECAAHRIGIDTGAFRSGCLTALVLEGDRRRLIQVIEKDGDIAVEKGTLQ